MAKKRNDQAVKPETNRAMTVVTPADVPTFYANNANIDLSNFDVRFRMAQIQGTSAEGLSVKEVVRVYMSHQHARVFHRVLGEMLPKMEEMAAKARAAEKK